MSTGLYANDVEWFWDQKIEVDGCWLWTGGRFYSGYGMVRWHRRTRRAHRVAYELATGPIPVGLQLDHICHDPATCRGGNNDPHRRCIRPAHLQLATTKTNNARARRHSPKREQSHCAQGHPLVLMPCKGRPDRRGCIQCRDQRSRESRIRRHAAAVSRDPAPRQTHCREGHPLVDMPYKDRPGYRVCTVCRARRDSERYAARRAS